MLIAVLAPEVIVGLAARQFLTARGLSKDYGFSKTHGFFLCMGGFVSSSGYPVTTRKQLDDPPLGPEFLTAIRDVDVEDIMDKSKGDALSKGLALAQGLWFTTQCLARVHQHLAVTQLEVATLAFAVVNVFIWLLWWGKPLDVQRPIVVGPPKAPDPQETRRVNLDALAKLVSVISGLYNMDEYDPTSSSSVPSFWSSEADKREDELYIMAILFECLVGSIFGAIHCSAWNAAFPTAEEMWTWRGCSLSVTAIPVFLAALLVLSEVTKNTFIQVEKDFMSIGKFQIQASIPIYILARISLITLPFMALRALPPGAFVDVNWSVYIPHL